MQAEKIEISEPSAVSVEVPEEKKIKRRQRREKAVLVGSKEQVWNGQADCTGGKLKKEDLMECPKTKRIISKKKHQSGLALIERAKKAREDPSDPLHEKFVLFFSHQYKKKPHDVAETVPKTPKKPRKKDAPSEVVVV